MEESNNNLIINYGIMLLVRILMVIYQKNIMYFFNHNQIVHLLFKGFETEDELELRKKISEL